MSKIIPATLEPQRTYRRVGGTEVAYTAWTTTGVHLTLAEDRYRVRVTEGLAPETAFGGAHGVPEGAVGTLIAVPTVLAATDLSTEPRTVAAAVGDVLDTNIGRFQITASTDPYSSRSGPYLVRV